MKFGVSKVKFCSFCNPSTWWKILNHIFWQSGGFWILKSLELENTNFTRFVSFPFVEKLPNSNLFWQNFEAFISPKFTKTNFAHFVSCSFGEKVLKYFFWQNWWLLKTPEFEKANYAHFVICRFDEKLLKNFFW